MGLACFYMVSDVAGGGIALFANGMALAVVSRELLPALCLVEGIGLIAARVVILVGSLLLNLTASISDHLVRAASMRTRDGRLGTRCL